MMPVSANLSCACRELRRIFLPNATARTITGGIAPSMMSVNCAEVIAIRLIPPSSNSVCRNIWGIAMIRVDSICVKSAERRLFSSPTRLWLKNDMGRQTRRA